MRERLFIFRLVVSLVLLVAIAPGTTPTMAAQPRRAVPVAPNPAADLIRVAAVRPITPAMHAGNVGRFAGEARSQVRDGDLRPRLGPSSPCEVWGTIDTDTMWSPAECDPYVVTGNLSVQSGATLTIRPGTTLKFGSLKVLAVAGTLVAQGTVTNPITFTSNQSSPAAGNWGHIYFADLSTDATFDGEGNYTGGSIIQHAVVEYAGGADVNHNGALRIEASSPFIDHNIIRDNQDDGIHVWSGSAPHITDNNITTSSDDGIHANDSDAIISDNTIDSNTGYGIHVHYGSSSQSRTATISNNAATRNTGYGIYLYYDHWNDNNVATISDNTVTNNTGRGIAVCYNFWNDNNTAVISGNAITGNAASNGSGIHVDYGSDNDNTTVTISNNTITGNSASNGGGIYISDGHPIIQSNTIVSNTATQANRGGGIYLCNGCRPTINDNNLYGNVTGDPADTPNDLYNGNTYASVAVNAENNYWGTADPAVIEDHIWHFMDDPSLGWVRYEPFRLSPVPPYTSTRAIEVTISGPPTGIVDTAYTFTATAGPLTVTQPITYAWQATGQSPVTHVGGLSDTVTFTWPTTGTHVIIVTASNTEGSANANHAITIRPPDHDVYEPDDTCVQASPIRTDGSPQDHTFHQHADEDWARFTVTSGITYILQAASTSPGADLVLELYDACGGNLEGSDDNTFGNDARLIFTAPSGGTYHARALNHDPAAYGPDVTYELSVRVQSQAGVAIIVAGRKYDPERLQANINYVANQAFRVFKNGGIPPEDIYYLHYDATQDADGDRSPDVDATATASTLEYALTTWAASRVGLGTPLYLYLVDHGTNNRFLIDGYSDAVTPDQLDGWLTTLENDTGCPVNVIIESCRSGSFVAAPQEISRPGRVIVSSAAAHQAAHAYRDGKGAYFSNHFLSLLSDNADLWTCYTRAHSFLEGVRLGQTPWLDDNGDAVSDERDGTIARQRGLISPTLGAIPWIASVSVPVQIDGYTAVITATVYEDEPSPLVWAEIIAPSYRAPEPEDEMAYVDVPKILLEDGDGDGTYTGPYGGFTEIGEYWVVVYARDSDDNQGLPRTTTVRTGWRIFLPLALSEVEGLVLSEVEGLVLSEVEGLVLSEVEGLALSKVE